MLLNMEHVSKTYGDRSLPEDVSFYMKDGDRVGVVGVNGCGKSTFLKLAASRETPDSGRVSYDPNVGLGYLPQDPPFDPENTVMAQVEAGDLVRQYPGGYTNYLLTLDTPKEKKPKAEPQQPRPQQKKLKYSYKEQRELEAALETKTERWLYLTEPAERIENGE